MTVGRRFLVLLLLVPLAACGRKPPPLPPIPDSAGPLMVKVGDPPPVHDGETVVDRVVGVVNDEVITMSELDEAVALLLRDVRTPPKTDKEVDDLRRSALDRLITNRLQIQEAHREKIEVSDEEVRAQVDDFVKRNGGDRDKIEAQLKAQGLSWEAIRRDFRDQLLAQRIRGRRVGRRATVTESEVDAYMAENRQKLEAGLKYHVRHIAILAEPPSSPEAWDQAKAEAEGLLGQLRGGADFAALAKEYSKDASAPAGGDLGWLARGELEATFEDPILKLPKGAVSPLIKSSVGYHIFLLEDKEGLTAELLADARQQARDILLQKKQQERMEEWVEGLRRRALIAVRL